MEFLHHPYLNLKISRIGFGCWPLGGYGWGDNISDVDIINSIHKALDLGINFFDTADVYGLGLSETRLGETIKPYRDQIVIATKFGVRFNDGEKYYDNSKQWLITALNDSLRRLKTDYIDIYQVHYWDNITPFEEILETLETFINAGKIRSFGVTNIDLSKQSSFLNSKFLASYSFEYSLLKRQHEQVVQNIVAKNKNLFFLAWGSLAQGLLSGKYNKDSIFSNTDVRSRKTYDNFHGEKLDRNLQFIDLLKHLQIRYYPEKTMAQLAIRWIMDCIPIATALVGIKTSAQIIDAAKSMGWNLHEEHKELLTKASNFSEKVTL